MLEFHTPTWKRPRAWQKVALEIAMAHLGQPKPDSGIVSAIMGAGKSMFLCELAACTILQEGEVIVVSTSTEGLVYELYNDLRKRCGMYKSVGVWYGRRKRMAQVVVVCVPSLGSFADALHQQRKSVALWIADEAHKTECDTVLAAEKMLQPAHSLGLTATAFRADKKQHITLFDKILFRYGVDEAQADGVVVPMTIASYQGSDDVTDEACVEMIKTAKGPGLANADSIKDAEEFAKLLTANGIPARAVHSKQSPYVRRKTLEDLKTGTIRCVVHVNLLTEGANYPWLCWLMLRREVESRVRFVQEVGRCLRAHHELIWGTITKREAVFYDPHDLWGSFNLSYKEALGEPPPKVALPFDITQPAEASRKITEADPPVAMEAIEAAVRTITVACMISGIMGDRKLIKKAERLKPSNDLQRVVMKQTLKSAAKYIPDGWQVALAAISERPDCVRYGFAADLISALNGVKAAKRWPNLDIEGRISGMPGEEPQEPAPVEPTVKLMAGEDGQAEIDFSAYADAVRAESINTWVRA